VCLERKKVFSKSAPISRRLLSVANFCFIPESATATAMMNLLTFRRNFSFTSALQTGKNALAKNYEFLKLSQKGKVFIIQLNRPKAFNALSNGLMTELGSVLDEFENDDEVATVVLTGSERAFAGNLFHT
jgi:hypothetical protein